MKILCTKYIRPGDKSVLTIGKEYVVLEVLLIPEDPQYRIKCDNDSPLSFSINQFDVIDSNLPKNYIATNFHQPIS